MNANNVLSYFVLAYERFGIAGVTILLIAILLALTIYILAKYNRLLSNWKLFRRWRISKMPPRSLDALNILVYDFPTENSATSKALLTDAFTTIRGVSVVRLRLKPITNDASNIEQRAQLAEAQALVEKHKYDIVVWGSVTTLGSTWSIKVSWIHFGGNEAPHINHHELAGTQSQLRKSLASDLIGVIAATVYMQSIKQDNLTRRWIESEANRLVKAGKLILASAESTIWTAFNRPAFEISILITRKALAQADGDFLALQQIVSELSNLQSGLDESLPKILQQTLAAEIGSGLTSLSDLGLCGDYAEQAVKQFELAILLSQDFKTIEDATLYSRFGDSLGNKARYLKGEQSKYYLQKSLDAYSQANIYFLADNNIWNSSMVAVRLCRTNAELAALGDSNAAAQLEPLIFNCKQAATFFKQSGSPAHASNAFHNAGMAGLIAAPKNDTVNRLLDSVSSFKKAIKLARINSVEWARSQTELATAYQSLARYQNDLTLCLNALQNFKNALAVYRSKELSEDFRILELKVAQASITAFNICTDKPKKCQLADQAREYFLASISSNVRNNTDQHFWSAYHGLGDIAYFNYRLKSQTTDLESAKSNYAKSIDFLSAAGNLEQQKTVKSALDSIS